MNHKNVATNPHKLPSRALLFVMIPSDSRYLIIFDFKKAKFYTE